MGKRWDGGRGFPARPVGEMGGEIVGVRHQMEGIEAVGRRRGMGRGCFLFFSSVLGGSARGTGDGSKEVEPVHHDDDDGRSLYIYYYY